MTSTRDVIVRAEQVVLAAPLLAAERTDPALQARVREIYLGTLGNGAAAGFASDDQRALFEAIRTIYRAGAPTVARSAVLLELIRSDPDAPYASREAALGFAVTAGAEGLDQVEYFASLIAEQAAWSEEAAARLQLRDTARELGDRLAAAPPDQVRRILEESRDRIDGELGVRTASGRVGFQFRTDEQLRALEPPGQLIEDVLPAGGLAALVGLPGSCKTFLALDWACAVSAGVHWLGGRTVVQGSVVYIIAEGSAALGPRLEAWADYKLAGRSAGVSFLTRAVQLLDDRDVRAFLAALKAQLPAPPVLIVVDTLARCMLGGDENSAQDMGRLVAGADQLRDETGACVLLIHHMNKGGDLERGSSALRGAVDILMSLRREEEGTLRLSPEKVKDAPPFEEIHLQLVPHVRSAVMTTLRRPRGDDGAFLHPSSLQLLRRLHDVATDSGVSTTVWLDASGMPSSSFYKFRKSLWDKGLVVSEKVGRSERYHLTPKGLEVMSP